MVDCGLTSEMSIVVDIRSTKVGSVEKSTTYDIGSKVGRVHVVWFGREVNL